MQLKDVVSQGLTIELAKAPSSLVLEIQQALAKLKLYPEQRIDGVYGPLTDAGWRSFKSTVNQAKPEFIGAGSANLLLKMKSNTNPSKFPATNFANRIFNICSEKGYKLDLRPNAVNIIGIEGMDVSGKPNNDAPDRWNDCVGLLGLVDDVPKMLCIYRGTTEPGRYYTMNPLNSGGGARLQLGQHKELWVVGKHRGYEAMQQVGAATLVRDKNRNFCRDDKVTVERWNGINLHTTKTTGWRGGYNSFIGQWSAGCVVITDPSQFLTFMKILKQSRQYTENRSHRFDFTLLWRDWFN